MDLSRHYFISDDLDDLDLVEQELEKAGIAAPQIHVLSRSNAEVHDHPDLTPVGSFMKRDIVHSTVIGAMIGVVMAVISLAVAFMAGWTNTLAGWTPFIFLAFVLLGFCTWFGGLHGLRVPNYHFQRFQKSLDEGRHVFFVDLDYSQEDLLEKVCQAHSHLEFAGTGESKPAWIIWLEIKTKNWWYWKMWRDA